MGSILITIQNENYKGKFVKEHLISHITTPKFIRIKIA